MKAYWDSLTKEQQGELAGKVGSTPGYALKQQLRLWLTR
ncbi:hypothetical protein LAW48_10220 [Escherichia coli]|nr:hypothetical protein [Escherichia coli]